MKTSKTNRGLWLLAALLMARSFTFAAPTGADEPIDTTKYKAFMGR